jgi:hypothetical protein
MKRKVFLGGTCGSSKWRELVKPHLLIEYYDPVCVGEWTHEAYLRELQERETADFVAYVITPKMTGVYSIAEVVDDSNKRPAKTLFCHLATDDEAVFSKAQLKSLIAVATMVKNNGGKVFEDLDELIRYLNTYAEPEIPEQTAVVPL